MDNYHEFKHTHDAYINYQLCFHKLNHCEPKINSQCNCDKFNNDAIDGSKVLVALIFLLMFRILCRHSILLWIFFMSCKKLLKGPNEKITKFARIPT